MSLLPTIPSAAHIHDERLRRILEAMKQNIEAFKGTTGTVGERFLNVDELEALRIVRTDANVVFNPNIIPEEDFVEQTEELTTVAVVDNAGNIVTDNDGRIVEVVL